MMYGHEQSDLGAVTVKPANKTRRRVAERVERRPRPKGRLGQQDMCRT